MVPEAIRDAISVNYSNYSCNTESDIFVMVFPQIDDYTIEKNEIDISNNGNSIPLEIRGRFNLNPVLNKLCERDFNEYELGIVQCKTNWNDNAQIPMLWDMIYNANGFENRNITIGRNGWSMKDLRRFTYSFVTVPSNNISYPPTSLAVKRVSNISGGNYWGRSSINHVCRSLKEIFNNNFQNGFNRSLREDLLTAIPYLNTSLSYFKVNH